MEQARFKRKTITMEVLLSQQQKKRFRRAVFYTVLFVLVTVVFLTVAFVVFFRVRNINITGNARYSVDDIIVSLPVKLEDNLYSFRADELETGLKKRFPYISEVNVTRKIPSHLNIEIIETDVAMYTEISGDYYLLSDGLRVLDRIEDPAIIPQGTMELKTSAVKRCIVGESASFIDSRAYDAIVELYKNITDSGIKNKIKTIDMTSRFDIYIHYEDRFKVYMGDMEYSDIKIQFLIGIIEKLKAEDKGRIDVSDYHVATATLS